MNILLAAADGALAREVQRAFNGPASQVDRASDGRGALELARTRPYDVVLLDLLLPRDGALGVTRALRREGRHQPILILATRDNVEDIVQGLDAGADDYVTTPFDAEELAARVRALARRGRAERLDVLRYGGIELDRRRRRVRVDGQPIDLTARELAVLERLLLQPEGLLSRAQLLAEVWGTDARPASNLVDVHVGNLRRKLARRAADPRIETVRGEGFRLRWERTSAGTTDGAHG